MSYCSGFCKKFDVCDKLGVLEFMKVFPIHPEDQPDKDWCYEVDVDPRKNNT